MIGHITEPEGPVPGTMQHAAMRLFASIRRRHPRRRAPKVYIRRGGGCWYIGQPPAGCPDTVDYASTVWMATTFEAAIKTANTLARTGKLPNGQTPEEFLR